MEFIEFIKSLFGSDKKSQSLEDLKTEIEKMQDNGVGDKPTLPDTPKYDRVTVDNPSDADIGMRAEQELAGVKQAGIDAVESETAAKKQKLETERQTAAERAEADKAAIDTAYDRADEQTNNDVLKRGVARSSIAVNRMADLSKARAEELAAVQKSYLNTVAAAQAKLDDLEAERQQALNSFNITMAAKLTERINALKAERDKAQIEAIKYNNTLTEKESKADRDKIMQESDLYTEQINQIAKQKDLESKYGTKQYRAVYEKMREYLSAMPKDEARAAVRNDEFFEENLSQYWFYKLYDEFGR